MTTLPAASGMANTNDTRIQPIAGTSAPASERIAQPAARQVTRRAAQQPSAAAGTGPTIQLYPNDPMIASIAPSANRTP